MARREIRISEEFEKAIQEYADLYCDGNFSMALRQLAKKGLETNSKP